MRNHPASALGLAARGSVEQFDRARWRLLARAAGQAVGDPRKVLYHPVVQVARDTSALGVGGVEGLLQQRFPLPLPLAQPPGERPSQRNLHQLQGDERADRHRRKALPDTPAGRRHGVVPVVRLEQQALSSRRTDRQIDLEQLSLRPFVPVLRLGQVADLRLDHAMVESGDLVRTQDV